MQASGKDDDATRVCVDIILPEDAPLPVADRLAVRTMKRWKPGRTLAIRFLDGHPSVHARVEKIASRWSEHANLRLEFGNRGDAQIRVGFRPGASWSVVGIDALGIPRGKPTMNLGWLTPETSDEAYERVVLHEFGHVLGCIHEHQSPAGGIPWDRQAVYAFYGRHPFGWSTQQVDTNIFQTYSGEVTQFSNFDPASIMLYPIPRELTGGRFEAGWNTALSETDIDFIGQVYPTPDASLQQLEPGAEAFEGTIATPGSTDAYRFDVPAPGRYVVETTGPTSLAMRMLGPDSEGVAGEDCGGGRGGNARIEEVLMEGTYVVRISHQRPDGTGRYRVSLRLLP